MKDEGTAGAFLSSSAAAIRDQQEPLLRVFSSTQTSRSSRSINEHTTKQSSASNSSANEFTTAAIPASESNSTTDDAHTSNADRFDGEQQQLQPNRRHRSLSTASSIGNNNNNDTSSSNNNENARRVLITRPSGVRGGDSSDSYDARIQKMMMAIEAATNSNDDDGNSGGNGSNNYHHSGHAIPLFFPWMLGYKIWWTCTALLAIVTCFFEPFHIAFHRQSVEIYNYNDTVAGTVELILTLIFAVDILVNFNLAYYKNERLIYERGEIVSAYLHGMFWIDVIGVFPFQTLVLWMIGEGELGGAGTTSSSNSNRALYVSLVRLLPFVRLHRMKKLSDAMQYNARISLLWFTLIRNFAATVFVAHVEACTMYFLARLGDFSDDTWLGPHVSDMTGLERYVTSLYLSIVTFCTVGYGDYSPKNPSEKIFGSIAMLMNIVVAAWIIVRNFSF
jgi:Ion transport protein